ncbi:hypothetical protein K501DRAFT_261881 [Backusella circina FSU 941]|nr:hypothetical protein K501DRAFT_261881 [Backusella circina FSU 941]
MDSSCPITENGTHAIQWIYNLFGDCVYGYQEMISLLLGYLSILCWLNAQMPQVIKNYRLRDADGLSFGFLTVWLMGDVANFIGCTITGQLPFQTYLSIYFIFVDTVLCLQWIYYVKYRDNFIRRWIDGNTGIEEVKSFNSKNIIEEGVPIATTSSSCGKEFNEQSTLLGSSPKPKYTTMLLVFGFISFGMTSSSKAPSGDNTIWIGRFFAWLCTFLYLGSRLPQIYQNARRRSVEGLSMALFFFAAMGNLTYVLGIFTNPHATRATILEAIPYIIGSSLTNVFDLTIFTQYAIYNKNNQILVEQV